MELLWSGVAATRGGGGTPVVGRREESSLAPVRHDGTVANRRRWGYNTGSMSFLSELRRTLLPARDSKHGPLPPLLVAMTFVTGLVDAFSYLLLGHVFVANMTGNVVLLGFALVGAPWVLGRRVGCVNGVVRPRGAGRRARRGSVRHAPRPPVDNRCDAAGSVSRRRAAARHSREHSPHGWLSVSADRRSRDGDGHTERRSAETGGA